MFLLVDEYLKQLRGKRIRGSKGEKVLLHFICGGTAPQRMTLAVKTFARQGCDCVYCGAKGTHVKSTPVIHNHKDGRKQSLKIVLYAKKPNGTFVAMTTDHIIPKAKGGTNNVNKNLQPMCFDCNQQKGSLMPSEVILGKKWWNKVSHERI